MKGLKYVAVTLILIVLIGVGVSPVFASEGSKKLTIWIEPDFEKFINERTKTYQAQHPGIRFEVVYMTSQDMRQTLKTALVAGRGPDIAYYDVGPAYMGILQKAGMLIDLTNIWTKMGWDNRIGKAAKVVCEYGGKVWGVGNEFEFVGLWYNKKIYKELGVSVPNNYDELTQICKKVKGANYIPIAFSDYDKWPAYHLFSIVVEDAVGPGGYEKILFGNDSWNQPEIVEATRRWFVEHNRRGFYVPYVNAVNYDDALSLFLTGKAVMHVTGTWILDHVVENMNTKDVGIITVPPSKPDRSGMAAFATGSGFMISSAAQHPKECILFLDYLMTRESSGRMLELVHRISPVATNVEKLDIPSIQKKIAKIVFASIVGGKSIGWITDIWTGPKFTKIMADGFQAVLAGEKSVEEQLHDLQSAWEKEKAEGVVRSF